jgi:hypothetical protein
MMHKLVYVAQPYSHSNPKTTRSRLRIGAEYIAKNLNCADDTVYYSPVCHGETVHQLGNVGGDYKVWKAHSLGMISLASEVHVLCLPGWQLSVGVADEISYANENGIPVRYFRKILTKFSEVDTDGNSVAINEELRIIGGAP